MFQTSRGFLTPDENVNLTVKCRLIIFRCDSRDFMDCCATCYEMLYGPRNLLAFLEYGKKFRVPEKAENLLTT